MDYNMLKSLCNLGTRCTVPAKLLGGQFQSHTQTVEKMPHLSSLGNTMEFWKWLVISKNESPPISNQVTHLLPGENLPFVSYCEFISFNWTDVPHELDLIFQIQMDLDI